MKLPTENQIAKRVRFLQGEIDRLHETLMHGHIRGRAAFACLCPRRILNNREINTLAQYRRLLAEIRDHRTGDVEKSAAWVRCGGWPLSRA